MEPAPCFETHLHLDGALPPETLQALARAQNYGPFKDKTLEEIRAMTVVDSPRESLAEVLAPFPLVHPLLRDRASLEIAAFESMRRCAEDGVLHAELRFGPALHAGPDFPMENAIEAVRAGLSRAHREFGISSGMIACLIRTFDEKINARTMDAAKKCARAAEGPDLVAIDVAGDEAGQPLSDFADFYREAKRAGLRTTAHAGEVPGSEDLKTALDLGIDRLGHATRLDETPDLLEEVRRRGLPIEVNLTSNLRTRAIGDYAAHPARRWFEAGIPILISTDDPGLFEIDLQGEFRLFRDRLGFSDEDLADLQRKTVDHLFLSDQEKGALRSRHG